MCAHNSVTPITVSCCCCCLYRNASTRHTAYRLERTNPGNLSSLAGTTVGSGVRRVRGRDQRAIPGRPIFLAILTMYDLGLLASSIVGVKDPFTAEGRDQQRGRPTDQGRRYFGLCNYVDRAPAYVNFTRHQFGPKWGMSPTRNRTPDPPLQSQAPNWSDWEGLLLRGSNRRTDSNRCLQSHKHPKADI